MICMTMIEHDILHTRMILCHDILHGDGLLYLEEVYHTDKVAWAPKTTVDLLMAICRLFYWQLCCNTI